MAVQHRRARHWGGSERARAHRAAGRRALRAGGQGHDAGNGGTGLGLPIVREILRLHNGSSLALSSEGEGCGIQFELALRLQEVAAADDDGADDDDTGDHGEMRVVSARIKGRTPQAVGRAILRRSLGESAASTAHVRAAAAAAADATTSSALPLAAASVEVDGGSSSRQRGQPSLRVLHVEDDTFLQKLVPRRIFKKVGLQFEQAADGQEALEMVLPDLSKFAVILLDNQMPRMNGTETARRLREAGYSGTIIGMTGDPSGCHERTAFEGSGIDVCVNKDSAGMSFVVETLRSMTSAEAGEAEAGRLRPPQ